MSICIVLIFSGNYHLWLPLLLMFVWAVSWLGYVTALTGWQEVLVHSCQIKYWSIFSASSCADHFAIECCKLKWQAVSIPLSVKLAVKASLFASHYLQCCSAVSTPVKWKALLNNPVISQSALHISSLWIHVDYIYLVVGWVVFLYM
jgi:hypothetical protein